MGLDDDTETGPLHEIPFMLRPQQDFTLSRMSHLAPIQIQHLKCPSLLTGFVKNTFRYSEELLHGRW